MTSCEKAPSMRGLFLWYGVAVTVPVRIRRAGKGVCRRPFTSAAVWYGGRKAVPVVVQLCGQGDGNAGEPFKDTPEVSCLP